MLSRFLPAVLLVVAAVTTSCDRVPLLGPSGSTITISANALTLAPGGSTEISATVIESGGTPVHDGTLVRFSASLGSVQPADVETRGGVATTTFVAGSASGTARIRAMSGAASGGEGEAPANTVEIAIGGAAATAVTVSANPSRVGPSGGTVTLIASALDNSGNRLAGVPITFATTAGTLSASSAISDANGDARVTLQLTAADARSVPAAGVTVTARAGEHEKTATVSVATISTVTLTTAPASPVAGSPVTLTVTPATGTSPRVLVTWGDGASDDLGIVAAVRSVAHTYQQPGVYTVAAQATAEGETFTTTTAVIVAARAPVGVNVAANPATAGECVAVVFTATATAEQGVSFSSFRWTIVGNNDDATVTTTGNQLTRVFKSAGIKTISVTVTTTDGRTGEGQTQVVITSANASC